jgi:hypothetical protein
LGRFENSHCDGAGPHTMTEVRIYPAGDSGNPHLCMHCFTVENQARYVRATIDERTGLRRQTELHDEFPQVDWSTAEVYAL